MSQNSPSDIRMRISSILSDSQYDCNRYHLRVDADGDNDTRDVQSEDETEDAVSETASTSTSSTGRRHRTQRRRTHRRPRPPCKKYSLEQVYFIWYHRTDLQQSWDEVERAFYRHFGDKREKGGLQCRFYRTLEEQKVEKVREQARSGRRRRGDMVGKYGVVQRTTERFPWM